MIFPRFTTAVAVGTFVLLAVQLSAAGPATSALTPVEARFVAVPTAAGALETSRVANARSHFAGSPGDLAFALWMRDRLRAAGFTAGLEGFTARADTLRHATLQIVDHTGRALRTFDLHEGPIAGDPDGTRSDAGIPYNAGCADGDIYGQLVAVGRGLAPDYAQLARRGGSVRGRVALVRYGGEYRGLLARRAQDAGAAAVIFYSDAQRAPRTTVQRGDVRAHDADAKIPTLPVTYVTAQALLAATAGGERVHLVVKLDRRVRTLWNTVGVLRGVSDDEVVIGAHRDAWVYGVIDNGSGIATVLDVARAFGALARAGTRFDRTIVIAGWDGEEIGGLGSGEYVQARAMALERHAIAYVNADEVVTGSRFDDDAAAAVGGVVTESARVLGTAHVPAQAAAPGGGSDHDSFLIGPGIPTTNAAFEGRLGTYHSAYDDLSEALAHDRKFTLHRRLAQIDALIAFRLVQATHPYRFTPYLKQLRDARAKLTLKQGVLGPLDAALARFAKAAGAYDADAAIVPLSNAIAATRGVDRTLYGTSGYKNVAFPSIVTAQASGNSAWIAKAVTSSARTIEAAARLLTRSPR